MSKIVKPLQLDEVLLAPTIASFSPAAFSPDNQLLAYVVTDTARQQDRPDRDVLPGSGIAWFGLAGDVWTSDLTTGQSHNLTGGTGHNWAPVWSPDGTRLAFYADRTPGPDIEPARLWLWDRAADELREVGSIDVQGSVFAAEWALGGSAVVVNTFPADLGREAYAARMKGVAIEPRTGGVTVKVFEFDPTTEGTAPSTDQLNLDLWSQDVAVVILDDGLCRPVITGRRVLHRSVSPDGKLLAYADLIGADEPGSGRYVSDFHVVDLESGEHRKLTSGVHFPLVGLPFTWSPDSRRLAYRSGAPSADDTVSVVDVDGGEPRQLSSVSRTDDMEIFEHAQPVWDAEGQTVFVMRERALWRIPVDGRAQPAPLAKFDGVVAELVAPRQGRTFSPQCPQRAVLLTTDEATKAVGMCQVDIETGLVDQIYEEDKRYGGYGTDPAVSPDGTRVALVAEDPVNPAEFFVREGDLIEARRVSQVAPGLSDRELGRAEIVEWRGLDGQELRGALVYPAGYEKGEKYPLIVVVYGGSELSKFLNSFGYSHSPIENLQLLATRGYAVLMADSKLRVGTPMVDLMKTVMPGVNKIVELGVADPDRIGVTGHSYGGYSTISLVAQSARFKAAVVRAGFADMISQYGQLGDDGSNYGLSWAESGQGRMGGHPWQFRDRYLENSPIFLLDRVETPVMIVHGSKDEAVPAYLADQMFTGLRRLGKAVTYLRYEDEGHWEGGWSRANQIDVLTRIFDWFDRHLKGDAGKES